MKPEKPLNIFLIGYRCTGKTTVGRRLAALTARRFVDTDNCFVDRYGVTIADFVADHGWDAFRKRESAVLETVAQGSDCVVATGGGIVLRPQNVRLMKKRGLVVWLTASPTIILDRMSADPASVDFRPGLTDYPLREEIDRTLTERSPLYENAKNMAIDTGNLTVEAVCRRVMEAATWKG